MHTFTFLVIVLALFSVARAQNNVCDPDGSRTDCGYVGITIDECQQKGCCWYPLYNDPSNLPWCFYDNAQENIPPPTQCLPGRILGNKYLGENQGTYFATWAPHTAQVWVNGSFNNQIQTLEMTLCDTDSIWGATIPTSVPGDEYNYIVSYLGTNYTRIDPFARIALSNAAGIYTTSVVHNTEFDWGNTTNFVGPSGMEQVIYEMQVATFNPSSSTSVGTFNQTIEKLDYLSELGINVIEPIPIIEFPGNGRSWGYNPGAPFAIELTLGGYNDFKEFVKQCNLRGIAVYVDIVWNHMNGPPDNGIWQYDGWYEYLNGFPSGFGLPGGIYFYQDENAETSWGPRPNFGDDTVRKYIYENIIMLMDECHVSGFRWDSTICIRKGEQLCWEMPNDNMEGYTLLQEANTLIQQRGKFSIAEDLQNNNTVTTPVSSGGVGFNAQWSDTSYYILQDNIVSQSDSSRNMADFIQVLTASYTNGQSGSTRVLYTENHDKASGQNAGQGRWPYMVNPTNPTSYISQKLSLIGIATVLLSPSVPLLFYGQEFLDTENFVFNDVPNFPWANVGNFNGTSWTSIGPYNGIFNYTRTLVRLRLNSDGVSSGLTSTDINVFFQSQSDLTVAFSRGSDQKIIVLMNLKNAAYSEGYKIGVPYSGTWTVALNSDLKAYSSVFGNVGAGITTLTASNTPLQGFPYQVNVPLGAYSTVVLIQQ